MSSGRIQRESFNGFRLFYIDGKKEYINEGSAAVDKEIKENHKLFDKIDVWFRFGNASSELTKLFDDAFASKLEAEQRQDPENWSSKFSYSEISSQIQKHQAKIDNPLKIEAEDISVYGSLPIDSLAYGTEWLLRNEGSQTGKKRQKNIIIFNKNKLNELHIRFNCNARVLQNDVHHDNLHYEKEGKCSLQVVLQKVITSQYWACKNMQKRAQKSILLQLLSSIKLFWNRCTILKSRDLK